MRLGRRGVGPRRLQAQMFREDRMRFGACWRWREARADGAQSLQCDPHCEQAWGTTDVFWLGRVGSEGSPGVRATASNCGLGLPLVCSHPTPPAEPKDSNLHTLEGPLPWPWVS